MVETSSEVDGSMASTYSSSTIDTASTDRKSIYINDFEVGKVIGEGAFGKVMLSKQKETGRVVAIK